MPPTPTWRRTRPRVHGDPDATAVTVCVHHGDMPLHPGVTVTVVDAARGVEADGTVRVCYPADGGGWWVDVEPRPGTTRVS